MGLCTEADNRAVIGKQLSTFADTYVASGELQRLLISPVVALSDKQMVLNKLFEKFLFAPTTRHFLLVLLENGRIREVQSVAMAFEHIMDQMDNRLQAEVVTAIPLQKADLTRIQKALERLTGKSIKLDPDVDPSLIGGGRIRTGNLVLDASVRTQLSNLQERLLS
jgi:F-type H+-transporting ATPase subunit delta